MKIDELSPYERGVYVGFFETWAFENGLHDDGVSYHRIPVVFPTDYLSDPTEMAYDLTFDFEKFLVVAEDLDDEGHIFAFGFDVRAGDAFVVLFCTEAANATWWKAEDETPDPRMMKLTERWTTWLADNAQLWGATTKPAERG